jgi:CelD/BcsL family acetyltransferase involved in cellulose biosynthesis
MPTSDIADCPQATMQKPNPSTTVTTRIPRVTAITSEEEFIAMGDVWNDVVDRVPAATVFLRHEWFEAAWAWRKRNSSLLCLAAYQDGTLIGILPLVITIHARGLYVERRLEFLTVPDTQMCDVIAALDSRAIVARAFAEELQRRRADWDVLHFDYLPDGSISGKELTEELEKRGFRSRTQGAGRNQFVALSGTWAEYHGTRSRRFKKANNLIANRLKKAGEVQIDWLQPGTEDAAAAGLALEAAIRISAHSWKRETGNSLGDPGPQAFIRSLSRHALRQGWLSLWILSLNGEPLAMEYQLVANASVHALRSDFVESSAEISPGSHLNRHLLENLFERELNRYYMGPGENAYKARWTSEGEPLHRIDVYGQTLRGRIAALRDLTVKPWYRRLRDRMMALRTTRVSSSPGTAVPDPADD